MRKNILLIHTDQQRYDSMGCTGNTTAETPNLDALAADGVLFTRQIAANTVCMPSRASLLTGLYPPAHGVWDNGVPLGRREYVPYNPLRHGEKIVFQPQTMADVFSAAGFRTAMFGKLHLTPFLAPHPYRFPESSSLWDKEPEAMAEWHGPYYGFEHVEMMCGHGPIPTGHFAEWIRRAHPDVVAAVRKSVEQKPIPDIPDLCRLDMPLELHPTSWLADRFISYLETARRSDAPFFAFVGFPDPHHPFAPTETAARRFDGRPVAGPYDREGAHWRNYVDGKIASRMTPTLSTSDQEMVIRHTNAMIWQIDRAVGRIIESLRANGLLDTTIIVFTSDHGDFMWDHALLRKGVGASHQLLHVPLIIRDPSRSAERRDETTSNCDILPTLAALCGVELPASSHGRDLFAGGTGADDARAFAYCSIGTADSTNYTIYDDRFRYTVYPQTGSRELFDHKGDPWESVNLLRGATAKDERRAARLHRELERALGTHFLPASGRVSAW